MKRRIILVGLLLATAVVAWLTIFPSLQSLSKSLTSADDTTRNLALAKIPGLNAQQKEKLVDELLLQTKNPDWQKRIFALYGLRKIGVGQEKIFPVVLEFLDDEEARVRQEAMIGLGEMGAAVAPALLELLPKKNARTQEGIVRALTAMGKEGLPHFVAALKNPDPHIRARAAEIIGQISPKLVEAAPDLKPLLQDGDALVRRKTAIALNLLTPAAIETLPAHIENLKRKSWDADTGASVKAVRHFEVRAKAAVLDLNALLKITTDSLKNKDAPRPLIAETLNKLDPRRNGMVGLLWDLKSNDAALRYRAAYTISETTPPNIGALPDLLKAMDDKDVFVRARATVAASRIGFDKSAQHQAALTKKAAESLTVVNDEQVEGFGETIRAALKIEAPKKAEEEPHAEDSPPTATAP